MIIRLERQEAFYSFSIFFNNMIEDTGLSNFKLGFLKGRDLVFCSNGSREPELY